MAEQEILSKELRVPELPISIHEKIERYISIMHGRTGKLITKPEAAVQLLEKATRNIKPIEA